MTARCGTRIHVRHVRLCHSRAARIALGVMRGLSRWHRLDMRDVDGLVRLRRWVAWLDRAAGMLGLGRTERFRWRRTNIRGVRVRVIQPTSPAAPVRLQDAASVLLYLHGGGFLLRALNGHMNLATAITRASGVDVAALPIYRLAPEHPFPAAVDDCAAVYTGLLHSGVPPHSIALAGDSAGGGLALKLLMRLRDAGLPLPACGLLLSPFTDLTCSGGSMIANAPHDPMFAGLSRFDTRFYLGVRDARDPCCSPLFGDFCGLPPLLAQVGSTERLLDDSLRLVSRVRRAGGELQVEIWDRMPHVWHTFGMPESRLAIRSAAHFVRSRMAIAREAAARAAAPALARAA